MVLHGPSNNSGGAANAISWASAMTSVCAAANSFAWAHCFPGYHFPLLLPIYLLGLWLALLMHQGGPISFAAADVNSIAWAHYFSRRSC